MYRILVNGNLFCSSKIEETAVINPVINLEANKAGTFTFVIPPNHPKYADIARKTSLIDVYRDNDTEPLFEGICASVNVDFYKQKTVVCEGELTFLNDSTLRPSKQENKTSRQLLETYIAEHNSLVESMKRFTVGQVTAHDTNDSIYCYTNYNSTMTEIKEDLIDDIGGYLRCRHVSGVRYLDYLAESPRTNNQVIKLGSNLLDLTQSLDSSDLATVVIPLGATLDTQSIAGLDERLTIKTAAADTMHPAGKDYVYLADAVNTYGWIEKVVTWDDVTTVSALLAKGKKYLQETQFENLIITARAIDLGLTESEFNKFRLLDSIRVVSQPHGLDRYFLLSKMTINLNNPENDSITLGIEEPKSLSAKTNSANAKIMERIEELPTSNQVQAAIDNATALITGAEGGYVVYSFNSSGQPVEIKIQDALNNPTKIWRWNQNGFGYSSDGGQTYGLAMTMDGAIVADFITAGTMIANRIRGGELLVGGSGLAANGSITVKDSSNNTVATLDKNGLDVKKGSIQGANITLGGSGNTNGSVTVKNSSGNTLSLLDNGGLKIYNSSGELLAWLDGAGIDFYENSNGTRTMVARLNSDGVYCTKGELYGTTLEQGVSDNANGFLKISNGIITGGVNGENTARLSFTDTVGGDRILHLSSDHNFRLNAETVSIGTNSQTVFRTHNNEASFILPTSLSSDGRVQAALQGQIFVNGMLVRGSW